MIWMCGPTVFAGRIAATPRGATWIFRGQLNEGSTAADDREEKLSE